jgi:hypothetical protein
VSGIFPHPWSQTNEPSESEEVQSVLPQLIELDNLYDAMTLNHVARRASKAQGVALLTLYSKGFTTTPSLSSYSDVGHSERQKSMRYLLDQFKLLVRREEVNGHLSVCWGALTAALGLPLGEYILGSRVAAIHGVTLASPSAIPPPLLTRPEPRLSSRPSQRTRAVQRAADASPRSWTLSGRRSLKMQRPADRGPSQIARGIIR